MQFNNIGPDIIELKIKAVLNSHKYKKNHKIIKKIKTYKEASEICTNLRYELSHTDSLFKIWVHCGAFTNKHSVIVKFYEPKTYKDYVKTEFDKLLESRSDEDHIKTVVKDNIGQKHIAASLAHNYNKIFDNEYLFDFEHYDTLILDAGNKIELYRVFTY